MQCPLQMDEESVRCIYFFIKHTHEFFDISSCLYPFIIKKQHLQILEIYELFLAKKLVKCVESSWLLLH